MKPLLLIGASFAVFLGIYLGFCSIKNIRYITKEDVKLRFLILNSAVAGISGFLIFFSIILVMGLLDKAYVWNPRKFLGAIFISLIPGTVITLGSFMQALMIAGTRKALVDALKRKNKDQ
jgi:hypothetical protein